MKNPTFREIEKISAHLDGQLPGAEAALLIGQSHFAVDALTQVEAMGVVFGGGQHQLGQRDVAGVDVHPSPPFPSE